MFCEKCGSRIPKDSIFCPGCGEKQNPLIQQPEDHKKPEIPVKTLVIVGSSFVVVIIAVIIVAMLRNEEEKIATQGPKEIVETPALTQEPDTNDDYMENYKEDEPNDENAASASDLLDAFIRGEIDAEGVYEGKTSFNIFDLENNEEEWLKYEVGERIDADNDDEEELIMNGPYGGMILDARDGKVVVLAEGEGTAGVLSIAKFEDAFWIVHSDTSHGGRQIYDLDKYNGKGEITGSISLSAEYWDNPDDQYDENSTFKFMNKPITMVEFEKIRDSIFAWQNSENKTEDYIFIDSSNRLLTERDLMGLSDEKLRIARNEIVARHGRMFNDESLQRYFESKPWYKGNVKPDDFDNYTMLSDLERTNMDFIKAHEGVGSELFQNGEYHIGGMIYGNYPVDGDLPPMYFDIKGNKIIISGSYRYVTGFDSDEYFGKKCSDNVVLTISPDLACYHTGEEGLYEDSKDSFFTYLRNGALYLHLYVKDGVVIRAIDSP